MYILVLFVLYLLHYRELLQICTNLYTRKLFYHCDSCAFNEGLTDDIYNCILQNFHCLFQTYILKINITINH